MSIYKIDGTPLSGAYDKSGNALSVVYNMRGKVIYPPINRTLKVMTYNVGGWYDGKGTNVPADKDQAYYDLQYGMIHDNDPDVLMMNEYWDQFSQKPRTAMSFLQELFPYTYAFGGNTQYYGRCFCSKFPLSGYQSHIYTGEASRYYDTIITTVDNVPITLCVTHLGLTADGRKTQVAELLAFAKTIKTPLIIAGDFNTAVTRRPDGTDYWNVLVPFKEAGYKLANCGDFGRFVTYRDGDSTGALDNIIFSRSFDITAVTVDHTKENDQLTERIDHEPLIATVTI